MTKIIQITDMHLFQDEDAEILSVKSNHRFTEVIQKIKEESPDYLFVTGDISQDHTEGSYKKAMQAIDTLGTKAYWIPGNHDDIGLMEQVFQESKFLQRRDHVEIANWNFIFLNSNQIGSASGWLAESELAKLENLLNQSSEHNTSIVMHHHPLEVNTPLIDQYILENKDEFWNIVNKYPNVKLIICGHVHGDYTIKHNQTTIECSPATCLQWKKGVFDMQIDKSIGYKKYFFNEIDYSSEAIIWG